MEKYSQQPSNFTTDDNLCHLLYSLDISAFGVQHNSQKSLCIDVPHVLMCPQLPYTDLGLIFDWPWYLSWIDLWSWIFWTFVSIFVVYEKWAFLKIYQSESANLRSPETMRMIVHVHGYKCCVMLPIIAFERSNLCNWVLGGRSFWSSNITTLTLYWESCRDSIGF